MVKLAFNNCNAVNNVFTGIAKYSIPKGKKLKKK